MKLFAFAEYVTQNRAYSLHIGNYCQLLKLGEFKSKKKNILGVKRELRWAFLAKPVEI
jgi:hypothetical protein